MANEDWRAVNRANWDERVGVHLAIGEGDPTPYRAGTARLDAIVAAEIGPVAGLRLLHLQCNMGQDTLVLAQAGATVTGLDFSPQAVAAARRLAEGAGLAARFVESDLYAAREALPGEAGTYDRVFVTWGAICWLPDIAEWARIVAHFLAPGGALYLAEGHPAAYVFDDAAERDGLPGFFAPYFDRAALVLDDPSDYLDQSAKLANARTMTWQHPLSAVHGALRDAGLAIDWLHEHPRLTWRMFRGLVKDAEGLWAWPDRAWLPLGYSLWAVRR